MSNVPAPPQGRPDPNASKTPIAPAEKKTPPTLFRGYDVPFFQVPDDIISVVSGKTDEFKREAMAQCRHSCEATKDVTPTTQQLQRCMAACYRGEEHVEQVKSHSKIMFAISAVSSAVVFGGLFRRKKRWPASADAWE